MANPDCKVRLFYAALAAILAIGLLATSERIVKSKNPEVPPASPLKLAGLSAAKIDIANLMSVPVSAGDLDPTFSGDGKLIDGTLLHSRDDANGVAIQADGKIVVAGSGENYPGTVARYNPDGSLDNTFGSGGWITGCHGRDVAIQVDGKIVVGCSVRYGSNLAFGIARYHADGSPDTAFGNSGRVSTRISAFDDFLQSIAVDANGKIVAAGTFYAAFPNRGIAVARYNPDGSPDLSFDGDGKLTTLVGEQGGEANSVAFQPDGKIVVAAEAFFASQFGYFFTLIRYNVDGTLDASFNSDGIASIGFDEGSSGAASVAIQPDGKIVAAGHSGTRFALARFNLDGSLDTTFDSDGKVTTAIASGTALLPDGANFVTIQPDGKIIAAGYSFVSSGLADTDLAIARYNSNGSLDMTFDGDGKVRTPVNQGVSEINSIAVQPDGRIVGVGSTSPWFESGGGSSTDRNNFVVARYNDNGSPDTTFDSDGIVITDFSYLSGSLSDVAILADGKLVAVGSKLARYNPDGTPDATFGDTGKVNIGGGALALQTDSKILIAGTYGCGDIGEVLGILTRVNQDGTPDASFGGDGTVELGSCDGQYSWFNSLAIQPDGKIVAAGSVVARYNSNGSLDTTFGGGDGVADLSNVDGVAVQPNGKIVATRTVGSYPNRDFGAARLNPDGSPDTSFDGDGTVATSITSGDDFANAVAIQPDGKIVAAGRSSNGSNKDLAIVRYNTNGSLDTSFSSDGIATTPASPGFDPATSIGIQIDGKLVVAGSSNADFTVYRYATNGTLDSTFSGDGIASVDLGILSDDHLNAMAFDGKGRAVLTGTSNGAMALARIRLQSNAPFDYDGDGRTDFSVYRPSNGTWYVARSGMSDMYVRPFFSYGVFPADYDGDGKADIATSDLDPYDSSSIFVTLNSSTNTISVRPFFSGDLVLAADFDGDGKADPAAWEQGFWQIAMSQSGSVRTQQWGVAGDKPVPADFDGDGKAELAVWRPSEGRWYIMNLAAGTLGQINWGVSGDIPLVGDYSGDGKADYAVYRPSNNTWYRLHSSDYSMHLQTWGILNDIVTPGDYDGDGRADLAIYRPSEGKWYVLTAAQTIVTSSFGEPGDVPTPSAFIY